MNSDAEAQAVQKQAASFEKVYSTDERQLYLLALSDEIRSLRDSQAIKSAACRLLGRQLAVNRAFYAEIEGNDWVVEGGFTEGANPLAAGRYSAATYGFRIMETFRRGERFVFSDARADPGFSTEEREAHRRIDVTSAVGVPLVKEGILIAILAVNCSRPRKWTEEEIEFVVETAERTWAAVERAQVEASLRESEANIRLLTESLPQLVWTCLPDGRCDYLSRQWIVYTGVPEEEQLDLNWLERVIHPEDQERTREHWLGAVAGRHPYDIEYRIRGADGTYRWFQTRGVPFRDGHGNIAKWFGTCTDITNLKQAEARNHFIVCLEDALRPLIEPSQITNTAARLLGGHLKANRCAYADVEDDQDTFNLTGDYNDGVDSIIGRYTFTQFGNECLHLMREGKPYIVTDSETDFRTETVLPSYRLTEIRSVICVSMLKQGRFVAALAVHQKTPRDWKADEVDLVQHVAARCWESIERAKLARELAQHSQRYKFLAESIPQMVWTADSEGALSYVNGQVTQYFGTDANIVLTNGWWQWVHPEDQERSTRCWKSSLQTGEPFESLFRLKRAHDRSWRWHLARAIPSTGPRGTVVDWFGTCTDIEDQKRAEAGLQLQWLTFDTALSHTPDFIYTFDLEGRFTYVNRALLSLWQMSLEEAVGKRFYELAYPALLAEQLQNQIQQVIRTKNVVKDHTPYTGPTGESREYEYIFVPVFGANGEVQAVAGSTRDMTDRVRFEKALADSELKLQQVFAQAPVAIVSVRGVDFVIEMANSYYRSLLPGRDLVARPFFEAIPELRNDVWEVFCNVYETGEPFVANEWLIPFDRNGDGYPEDHWFNVVYNPLRETNGQVGGIIAVLTDVTKHVRMRKELETANRELEEFAYIASHDLQEPLRMINIYGQLLVRRLGQNDETAKGYSGFIQEGITRMETLLRDLLLYSKTSHQDKSTMVEHADLSASLAQATADLSTRIEETGAVIIASPLPKVVGETQQLAHVFQNLLSNALKYRNETVAPQIRISAQASDEQWIISVTDNGIGFESKYAERIFGLFKRLHKDEYPGTGLGLAICQRIVERYGGRMWAEGQLGEGATFFFSLPKSKEQ